jgi:hypothetical protein
MNREAGTSSTLLLRDVSLQMVFMAAAGLCAGCERA